MGRWYRSLPNRVNHAATPRHSRRKINAAARLLQSRYSCAAQTIARSRAMSATPDQSLTMPLGEAIYSLRAIRRFRPDPVPDDVLRTMLDAAIHAPNGGNAQPWRFVVVRDAALREQFAPLYREAWWAKRRDQGILKPEDIAPDDRVARAAMRLADEFGNAPAFVLVCARAQGAGAMGSVIPAVQNLLLAGRALGVGGTITTLHPTVDARVHALFGIPETAQIVYCVPLGYPNGRFGPTVRLPLSKVCAFERWDAPASW
jgi:nitroreductase